MLVMALIPAMAAAADAPFFNFSMATLPEEDGTYASMKFAEVDRTDAKSVVEVSGTTPGSNWSTNFLLLSMCGLAKAREQRYFQAREIDDNPLTFEITFPPTAPNAASVPTSAMAPNVFPVSKCPVLTYEPKK